MATEPDKYIVELEELKNLDGTESIPLQLKIDDESIKDLTTFRALVSTLKKYVYEDAPSDGYSYARKNGQWVRI